MAFLDTFRAKKPNPAEQAELDRHEQVIRAHISTYASTGKALAAIRDQQLYRWTHETFEVYLAERWKMERSQAYRLIAAAGVAENLWAKTEEAPPTERHARPLATLAPDDQVNAWQDAKAAAGNQQPSAAQVREAVARRRPGATKRKKPKPVRLRLPGGIVIIEPGRNFTSAAELLHQALAKLSSPAQKAA